MKTKHLLLAVVVIFTALTVVAQDATNKKYAEPDIPFGKKLPPPDLTQYPGIVLPQMMPPDTKTILMPGKNRPDINAIKKQLEIYRQQLQTQRNGETIPFQGNGNNAKVKHANSNSSDFHLTKDISALAESNPRNFTNHSIDIYDIPHNDSVSYAVLDDTIYFVADDGIHGSELWRSDGTAAGTYMLKDLEPGATSSLLFNITAANGKIYFTAYSTVYGSGAWVSDGTESGTQLLVDVSESTEFFTMGNKVYFIAHGFDYWSALWETDGTAAGTKQVIELGDKGFGGQQILQPTVVNGLLFFIFLDYETLGWQLWRSDLTVAGTYHVGPSYPALDSTGNITNNTPAQLTNYNNKLYFSANDGTGRKLWVSNGSDAGTKLAPGNHSVIINADFLGTSFPVLNNVLYIPGEKAHGNGLYIYDASNTEGLVKIKDFARDGDTAFIVPFEMHATANTVYFKVINHAGGINDELWSSKGTKASTQLVYKLLPGETMNHLYNGSNTLYFVKKDKFFGTELWKVLETRLGKFPIIESNAFAGATSSYPGYFTTFKNRVVFSAADEKKGNELFMTNSFGAAAIVKDIKTINTTSSNAGWNPYGYTGYIGMAALGNTLLFNAYERVHGYELYKSDGSAAGTELLNDIIPGEAGFNLFYQFLSKNSAVYFSAASGTTSGNYFIYKTNGTKSGLSKIVSDSFFIQSFSIADNGLVFYTAYNNNTSLYELWRSDGTAAGTDLLSSSVYSSDYLNVVGNTAFFVSGDAVNGYELWKSDGSVSGTEIVKDINPGNGGSFPKGMFIYKDEVYFAADDKGTGSNSFWKSDGTQSGTFKLRDIDPWYSTSAYSTARYYFEVSNNILYFSAINYNNTKGTQLWRTDGTVKGTWSVKDISPIANSFYPVPFYFTDVNGTLFFIGDDGVSGAELWKTDGTEEGTVLVKDITPGAGSSLRNLVSFAGKLYFTNSSFLWSSDGTAEGTVAVDDAVISGVNVYNIVTANDKLFLSGFTQQYGTELYWGKGNNEEKFIASKITNEDAIKTNLSFNAVIYPNPVASNATLQITGNAKNVSISITDMSGKKIWQSNKSNAKLIKLPVEKYAAGVYIIIVTNGKESKIIKLVKQ